MGIAVVKSSDIGILFGRAAGKCSFCKIDLFENDVRIGEMAHIIAKSKIGPRGQLPLSVGLNSYENLILVCRNHHGLIDGAPDEFPPKALLKKKADHEAWVQAALSQSTARSTDVAGLQALMRYLPFTQFPSMVEQLPLTLDSNFMIAVSTIDAFPIDNPQCCPFSDTELERLYADFRHKVRTLADITLSEMDGITTYNDYYPNGRNQMLILLNRDLPYGSKTQIKQVISEWVTSFYPTYYSLLRYLQSQYPEVDVSSFR